MKGTRWVFGAVAVACLVALVAPAVGQGKAESASLAWSRSRGGPIITSYDFGAVDGGSRATQGLTLGNSTVTKSGKLKIRLTGSSAFSITVDDCTKKSIGQKLSCRVGISYLPLGPGSSDGATLTATGAHGATASLSLAGNNTGPAGHVYWVGGLNDGGGYGNVNKVPRGGGNVTTLASGPKRRYGVAVVDSANVYWVAWDSGARDGTVSEVPIAGGSVTTLATGQNVPVSIAVDGAHVYWVNAGDGTVKEVPVGGGSVTTLASGQENPTSLAVDGTNVYWVDQGTGQPFADGMVNEVPVGGGSVTTLASGQKSPVSVAVEGTNVYWVDEGTSSASTDGTVNEVPVGGGAVTTLASGQDYPISLAVDNTHVYWDNAPGFPAFALGTVNEVPLGGGTVTTLASGSADAGPLAVDGTHVYCACGGGEAPAKIPLAGGRITFLAPDQTTDSVAVGP
jgi:hypothetical protein